jgi:hypothetical protein
MINLFPIQEQMQHPIFMRFNNLYGKVLSDFCPLLLKFQINIFSKAEFLTDRLGLPFVEINENDPFAYSSDLQDDDIANTRAGIIYNQTCIDAIGLTEEEQFAAISHEIGHIIYRFSNQKDIYHGPQGQEIFADSVAREIGLAKQLLSTLEKMEKSGLFPEPISQFGMRKLFINKEQ